MRRRVFMSFQHRDLARARGFDLMQRAPNVTAEFSVRHMLTPAASTDPDYIGKQIRQQMKYTSVTVVLIGRDTHASDWVAREVQWSLAKDPPNGLLGIRIDPLAPVPAGLQDCGAEIIDWTQPSTIDVFQAAIERAALRAGRAAAIASSVAGSDPGCGR